jgi:pyruvate kinase
MDTSRRTKIVATAGPATDNPTVLAEMLRAGVNVVRLNASHGNRDDLRRRLALVRETAQTANLCIGVLLDLGGPKIRIEGFVGGKVMLKEGDPFTLDIAMDPKGGTAEGVGVAYKNLPHDVSAGDTLLCVSAVSCPIAKV